MSVFQSLLALFSLFFLFNTALSLVLWVKHKILLHKLFFFIWASSFFTFVAQGALIQNDYATVFGFSFNFLTNVAIALLISNIAKIKTPITLFCIIIAISHSLSLIFFLMHLPFTIIALPMSIGLAYPLLHSAGNALTKKWNNLTFSGKAFCITSLVMVIHFMDYPFLRFVQQSGPDTASIGLIIAMLMVFAISVFGNSVILEITTEKQAKTSAELDIARKIQLDILPDNPQIPNFELACCMQAADEVGGDYYDVHTFDNYSWIFMGDVTGHGLGSGLVMFMVQSIISSILHTKQDITPSELNEIANTILFNNLERLNEKRPMTLLSLCLKNDGQFAVNGSNCSIYIYRDKTEEVEILSINHFPLGIGFQSKLNITKTEDLFKLNKNDVLFIGTDGITEAAFEGDYKKGMFGEERLINLLKDCAYLDINEIKECTIKTLKEFTLDKFHDDITFIIARAQNV
jgi:serine phosphatase RsbU (regulator of sigma subunit)